MHNANIIKKQIQTAPMKCITYPQIVRVYIKCVIFTLTRVHCNPTADHCMWYYVTTLHRIFYVSQNMAFEGITRKAHQVSASNIHKFSIKCTCAAISFYLAICVLNDYKQNSSLTIEYFMVLSRINLYFQKNNQVLSFFFFFFFFWGGGPFILMSTIATIFLLASGFCSTIAIYVMNDYQYKHNLLLPVDYLQHSSITTKSVPFFKPKHVLGCRIDMTRAQQVNLPT